MNDKCQNKTITYQLVNGCGTSHIKNKLFLETAS